MARHVDKNRKKVKLTATSTREGDMTAREAIRILMLSPIYFKLSPYLRKKLIQEYCKLFNTPSMVAEK